MNAATVTLKEMNGKELWYKEETYVTHAGFRWAPLTEPNINIIIMMTRPNASAVCKFEGGWSTSKGTHDMQPAKVIIPVPSNSAKNAEMASCIDDFILF